MMQEAIACRQRAGDGPRQASALTELCRYLGCRGLLTGTLRRRSLRRLGSLQARWKKAWELACVYAARAWLAGGARGHEEIDACLHLARTAIQVAEDSGDDETALDALVTLGTAELGRDVAGTDGRHSSARSCSAGARPTRSRSRGRSTTSVDSAFSR